MNRRTIVLASSGLAIAAFVVGVGLYRTRPELKEPVSKAPSASIRPLAAPYIRSHSPIIGPADAPVTISEFLDPACEACRAFHPIMKRIVNAFPGKVRIALRYTAFHRPSKEAIAILEAARKQDKFVPVLEALFARQSAWAPHGRPGRSPWEFLAGTGLDIVRAKIDAKHPEVVALINQDASDVKALGVRQTPTFFVNGKPLQKFSAQGLFDLVKQEVETLS